LWHWSRLLHARVELRTATSGRLRVACLPALAQAMLPGALARLTRQVPQAAVSVFPMESPWLEQAMSEQRFDIGLGETTQAPVGVALTTLLEVNEVAVLPAEHVLGRRQELQLQDFANERFISLAHDDPYRTLIDQLFEAAGVARNNCLETGSAVAVCAMVRQGLGIAIVNPLTAHAMAGPDLVVRPLAARIPFKVSLLLPEMATPHPLRARAGSSACGICQHLPIPCVIFGQGGSNAAVHGDLKQARLDVCTRWWNTATLHDTQAGAGNCIAKQVLGNLDRNPI
jgi:DNA-binding transcriptional LysR family regulator